MARIDYSSSLLKINKHSEIAFLVQYLVFEDNDSKQFVDLNLKKDIDSIHDEYVELLKKYKIDLCKILDLFLNKQINLKEELSKEFIDDLKIFVENNFFKDDEDFKSVKIDLPSLPGWTSSLGEELKKIVEKIIKLWGKYAKKDVFEEDNLNSHIKLNDIFFVPGGRFKELYYWDSYWIMLGLISSDMDFYAHKLISCFVDLINKFGYIPNGTRTYYLGRSQPPLFCQMLEKLYKSTNKEEIKSYILNEGLEAAVKEYNHFMDKKRTDLEKKDDIRLNRYYIQDKFPRQESLKEDLDTFRKQKNKNDENVFRNLRAGAESGWDFSSRWFPDEETLFELDVINVYPVDLNSFMLMNEQIISFLFSEKKILSRDDKERKMLDKAIKKFDTYAIKRSSEMNYFLWNDEEKCWNDFNVSTRSHKVKRFYFSNITPLFAGLIPPDENISNYDILYKYRKELFGYPGGVPCSGKPKRTPSKPQQWDFPNTWAPHVQMLVNYLERIGENNVGEHVARSFFKSVYSAYKSNGEFHEKYDCEKIGIKGEGGEYDPQEGFGWTNGTIMSFIKQYKNSLLDEINHEDSYQNVIVNLNVKVFDNKLSSEIPNEIEMLSQLAS